MLLGHQRCLENWDQNRIVVLAEIQRNLPVKLGDHVLLSFDEQVLRAEQLLAIVVGWLPSESSARRPMVSSHFSASSNNEMV